MSCDSSFDVAGLVGLEPAILLIRTALRTAIGTTILQDKWLTTCGDIVGLCVYDLLFIPHSYAHIHRRNNRRF
jgi:hypothetical protein